VNRRLFFARTLLICLSLLLLLVGCAGNVTPTTTPTTAPASTANSSATPVTLYLWHAWPNPEQRALNVLIERFNAANPLIRIVPQVRPVATLLSDMQAAVSEGRGPHLVLLQSHALGSLAEEGALLALDDQLSPTDLERLLPVTLGTVRLTSDAGTQLYGVPLTLDTPVLFYNRANWLRAPLDTETWLDGARTLTDADATPPTWGLAYHLSLDKTVGYLYAFGGKVFDDSGELVLGTTGEASAVRWLEWLLSLKQDSRLLASLDPMAVDNALLSQQALMTVDWTHALPTYRRLWGEQLGIAPLPRVTVDERLPQPYIQSELLALSALVIKLDEQRAALTFVRYMIGEEAQQELLRVGRQPVLAQLALPDDDPDAAIVNVVRQQAAYSLPMPNSRIANTVVWATMDEMRSNVLRGLLEPEQAVAAADASLRTRLGLPAVTR
jgi:ABC-type glycerol-3-phosphate transport system substrate-binding protein